MKKIKESDEAVGTHVIDSLVQELVKERKSGELETDEHFTARWKSELHKSWDQFKARVKSGLNILAKREKLHSDSRFQHSIELIENRVLLEESLKENKTLQEIFKFSDEEMVQFYEEGLASYQRENPEEASDVFMLLTQLNPKVGAFWLGLGAAEEKRGELKDAVNAYLLGAEIETRTLSGYLQGARCLLILDKKEKAREVLKRALERSDQESSLSKDKELVQEMLTKMM